MSSKATNKESIVFVGVDVELFKRCFFREDAEEEAKNMPKSYSWSAVDLVCLDDSSPTIASDLTSAIQKQGVLSVVFQSTDMDASILTTLIDFYTEGGLVVFFGIYGEFNAPTRLSDLFGLHEQWSFSAYTKHEYEVTYTGMDYLGPSYMTQQYTKSNLLRVPVQDRWMVAKAQPLHQYIDEYAGSLDGQPPDEEWNQEVSRAKAGYLAYCEKQYEQCPLAVHKNDKGGRIAYLGFVNGDGNIPKYVRSLLTKKQIPSHTSIFGWS